MLPTPAPAGPYATSLSAFDGTDPNGEWSLYVNDDADGGGGFFTNRFQLGIATVPRPNAPPVALRDLYEGREDRVLSRSAPGVLRNDSDADGGKLTAAIVRRPEHGRLDLNANGSFTYRPNRNFNGRDTFVYRARDGKGGTDRATVTIRVRKLA